MATKLSQRLAGIFALIEYVQLRGNCDLNELASHFGMEPNQVVTLLTQLSVIDLPHLDLDDLPVVDFDLLEDGEVEFLSVPDLQLFHFSKGEATALVLALQLLAPTLSAAKSQAVESLYQKLVEYYQLADFSEFLSVATNPCQQASHALLAEAIESGKRVTFDYQNASGEISHRAITPLSLEIKAGNLLVRGFCFTSGQERSFRVTRMHNLTLTDEKPPVGEVAQGKGRVRYPQVEVTLEQLPESLKEAALKVVETPQHVVVTLRLLDARWLETQLLLHADLVLKCSDAHLFKRVRESATAALEMYDVLGAKSP